MANKEMQVFAELGWVHNIDLYHEYPYAGSPLKVYPSEAAFYRDHPERDEHDFPVKVRLTYEVERLTEDEKEEGERELLNLLAKLERKKE